MAVPSPSTISQWTDLANQTIESSPPFEFSSQEHSILELYDELLSLREEHVLLQASLDTKLNEPVSTSLTDSEYDEQLSRAQQSLLESRARYVLAQSAVELIVTVDPTIKAIHGGINAPVLERALHPLVDTRDVLALIETNLERMRERADADVRSAELDNVALAGEIESLEREIKDLEGRRGEKQSDAEDMEVDLVKQDENAKERELVNRLRELEKKSEMRDVMWKIVKGLGCAIVAGSGVDWSGEEELKKLVLYDES